MPIKDQSIYPPYWKQFSLYIRKERAEDRCEDCKVGNGFLKFKSKSAGDQIVDPANESALISADAWYLDTDYTVTKIVLTVAHLDNEGGICDCKERTGLKCAIPSHVKALCQKCHLALDLPKHIANRRESQMKQKDEGRHLFAAIV